MCQFKSGIILKNRCYIAQGDNNSHTMLLEELNIEDTIENSMTEFVRAELIPDDNKWWTNPDEWVFNIEQFITPNWFFADREKYEKDFKEAVKEWCNVHVLIDKKIDELSNGFYMIKGCRVENLCNDVRVMCDSSTVSRMHDRSSISEMRNGSTVNVMRDSSTVNVMRDISIVNEMRDSSTVRVMRDISTVRAMYDSSMVWNFGLKLNENN